MMIPETLCWLSVVVAFWSCAVGLKIDTSSNVCNAARGHSVVLPCLFQFDPEESEPLEIEWSLLQSGIYQTPELMVQYHKGNMSSGFDLNGRARFYSSKPETGDASLQINDVQESDSGTYQCQVGKDAPRLKRTRLVVMEKPSKPLCDMVGEAKEGKKVVLRCNSLQGSDAIRYRWVKISGNTTIPQVTYVRGNVAKLVFSGLTRDAPGTYRCRVESAVGSEHCDVELQMKAKPEPKSKPKPKPKPKTRDEPTPTPTPTPTLATTFSLMSTLITAGSTLSVVFVIGICLAAFCRCRRRRPESSNEYMIDKASPHRWLAKSKDQDQHPSQVESLAYTKDKQNHKKMSTMSLMQIETAKKDESVYENPVDVMSRENASSLKESCDVRKASTVVYWRQDAPPDPVDSIYEIIDI